MKFIFYESIGFYLLSPSTPTSTPTLSFFGCDLNIDSAFSIFILGIFGVIYFIFSYLLFNIIQFFYHSFFVMPLLDQKMPCGDTQETHKYIPTSFFYFFIEFHFSFFENLIWMSNNILYWKAREKNEAGIDIEYFITNNNNNKNDTKLFNLFHFFCL